MGRGGGAAGLVGVQRASACRWLRRPHDDNRRGAANPVAQARYEALAPLPVKGRTHAVTAFRVVAADDPGSNPEPSPLIPALLAAQQAAAAEFMSGLLTSAAPAEALAELALPLVGRDAELALLAARLAALVDGRGGGAVFVEGDAGMGKTRLAKEVAWGGGLAALRQRCVLLVGVGLAERRTETFYPWRRVFRQVSNMSMRVSIPVSIRKEGRRPRALMMLGLGQSR